MRGIRGFLLLVSMLLLAASCAGNGDNSVSVGAGGGAGTVAGVAASGSELIGYAFLKDSVGAVLGPRSIGPDGGFSFDVSGMTPPFYLRAEGNAGGMAVKLHSFAAGPGTTHINPLTNIAVASAAGVNNPGAVYADPSSYVITQASLDAATAELRAMLKPLLIAYDGDINPFTGAYLANHTGMDGLFDVASVELDKTTGTVTVANRATGAVIGSAAVTGLAHPTNTILTVDVPLPTVLDDLVEIKAMLLSFAVAMNKGIYLAASDIDPFYAASYGINDGLTRAQVIAAEAANKLAARKSINGTSGLNISPAGGGDYTVNGAFLFSDGSLYFPDEGYTVTKEAGAWKFKGNGFKSRPDMAAASYKWKKADSTTRIESGIRFRIEDPGAYGFKSAVITGPGLPVGGIHLADLCPAALCIEAADRNNTRPTDAETFYLIGDTEIDSMPDNAEYTLNIYDAAPSLVETRTIRLHKPPFKRTELVASEYFPRLPDIATHGIAEANIGGTLAVSFQLPGAYSAAWLRAGLEFWDGAGNSASYWKKNPSLTAGPLEIISATPAWTPISAAIRLQVKGVFRRETVLVWMFE